MADAEPFSASLDRLEAAMTKLAAAQASMDSNLHASQLRFAMTQASMLFKLDFIILKLDTMISNQRSPFPFSLQPPPTDAPMLTPFPMPTTIPCLAPKQHSPTPISTPLPMAGKGDGPIIGIDSGTTYFPVSMWQHHRVNINRQFQPNQPLPLLLRTNHCRYRKIPYDNIILLGDAAVAHRIHLCWIWVLSATETQLCFVRHQFQRPPPHPPPPPKPPPLPPPWLAQAELHRYVCYDCQH
ncbi:Chloroplast envelope membrane heat shock-related protein [Glycine soja]